MNRKINFSVIIVLISIICLFFSCEGREDGPCEIKSDYYFTGLVFSEEICLNDGHDGVGINCGFYPNAVGDPDRGTYRFGLDTEPVLRFDRWISFVTPEVYKTNFTYLWEIFEPGIKFFTDPSTLSNKKFDFEYTMITSVMTNIPALTHYFTIYGDQSGSTLQVLEREEITEPGSEYRDFRVKMIINCKLYNQNGAYQGEILDLETQLKISVLQ
ncbi:hypothetical protein ACFLTI_02495 [Bacteroidota bacterium]